jgi:hypothetical protein
MPSQPGERRAFATLDSPTESEKRASAVVEVRLSAPGDNLGISMCVLKRSRRPSRPKSQGFLHGISEALALKTSKLTAGARKRTRNAITVDKA